MSAPLEMLCELRETPKWQRGNKLTRVTRMRFIPLRDHLSASSPALQAGEGLPIPPGSPNPSTGAA
jgi:hypothetical protein